MTYSMIQQYHGSGNSPILSNIYLDRLDKYVENVLVPVYNRKEKRNENHEYRKWFDRARYLRKKGLKREAAKARKQQLQLPQRDPDDPEYRRLRYVRYADDFLLGFAGPEIEAEEIIARFGGIPLRRQEKAVIRDINPNQVVVPRNELVKRLLRDTCELCGNKENVQVHHIRKLSDLKGKGRENHFGCKS